MKPTGLRVVWVSVLGSWVSDKVWRNFVIIYIHRYIFLCLFPTNIILFFTLRIYGSFYAEHSFCHLISLNETIWSSFHFSLVVRAFNSIWYLCSILVRGNIRRWLGVSLYGSSVLIYIILVRGNSGGYVLRVVLLTKYADSRNK